MRHRDHSMNGGKSMRERTIKVLYMCEWTGRGIHPVWLHYAHGLQTAGVDVHVATSGREYDPGTLQGAVDLGLNVVIVPEFFDREKQFRGAKSAMATWLSHNSVDIIHCQGFRELHDIARACRAAGTRPFIVMTDRNSLAWTGLDAVKRIAIILRERPYIIALSQSHYGKLTRIPGMATKVAFVPNGVNAELFPYVSRTRQGGDRALRLIYPASFTPLKGHMAFLDVCRDMVASGRRFEVLFAGYGPLEESVRARTKAMGLAGYVKQLGRVPWKELPDLYAKCDIGVFPSLSEMMPNAVLEMMSSGLPVVAYDTGGICQMIDHGRTGYVAPVGDKERFRYCLEQVMDHWDIALTMGPAASACVRDKFSIKIVGQQTVALYRSVCIGGQRR